MSYAPRILVVEKAGSTRDLLDCLLSQEGYSVAAVATIDLALRSLRALKFQLAVLDFNHLDGDGLTLLQHIRAEFPRTKILVMASVEMVLPLAAIGATPTLTTLESPESLLNAVYRLLDPSGEWAVGPLATGSRSAADARMHEVVDECLKIFRDHPNANVARFAAALTRCPDCTNRCPGIEQCANLLQDQAV
jgi:DNA-binding response OmpR family regulator